MVGRVHRQSHRHPVGRPRISEGDSRINYFTTEDAAEIHQEFSIEFFTLRPSDACATGDTNGDGRVDSSDARLIQRVAVGQLPAEALRCAPPPAD